MERGMTIMDMLGQSGILTLLGMGVVFGFLFILVIAVIVVGKIIHGLGLDKDVAQPENSAGSGGAAKTTAVAAAITAAVTEYRKNETV